MAQSAVPWWRSIRVVAGAIVLAAAGAAILVACQLPDDTGYIEIKAAPVLPTLAPPVLFLDSVKLDPLKKGNAVLRVRTGTAKLAVENGAGYLAPICEIQVKKNRITTVTLSIMERPPRCQCRNSGFKATARTCVS